MAESEKPIACGGILINFKGEVLLRQPTGRFDGYVWTFPKGRPEPGESHEQAALREVLEETGYEATIRIRLPGEYEGGTTRNIYFLMEPGQRVQEPDHETAEVRWVSPEEAHTLIGQTENLPGRERDLKILEIVAACQCVYDVSPCVHVCGLIEAPIQMEAGSEEEAYQLAHAALDLYSLEDFEKKFNTRWSFLDLDFEEPLYSTKLGDIRRLPVSHARKLVSNWQDDDGVPLEDHLNLTGLTEMPKELAKTLAIHHQGSISFSPAIEAEFRKHVTLTADILRQAVDFDEPLDNEDGLGHDLLSSNLDASWYWYIEDEAAELLALCSSADLKSLREISDKSAKALGQTEHCAELWLWNLEILSEEGAKWIAEFGSGGALLELVIEGLPEPAYSILKDALNRQEKHQEEQKRKWPIAPKPPPKPKP